VQCIRPQLLITERVEAEHALTIELLHFEIGFCGWQSGGRLGVAARSQERGC
jgi:hypothetical protein